MALQCLCCRLSCERLTCANIRVKFPLFVSNCVVCICYNTASLLCESEGVKESQYKGERWTKGYYWPISFVATQQWTNICVITKSYSDNSSFLRSRFMSARAHPHFTRYFKGLTPVRYWMGYLSWGLILPLTQIFWTQNVEALKHHVDIGWRFLHSLWSFLVRFA